MPPLLFAAPDPLYPNRCTCILSRGPRAHTICRKKITKRRVPSTYVHTYCVNHKVPYIHFEHEYLPTLPLEMDYDFQNEPRYMNLPYYVIDMLRYLAREKAQQEQSRMDWNAVVLQWANLAPPDFGTGLNEGLNTGGGITADQTTNTPDYESFPADPPLPDDCIVCLENSKLLVTACRHVICTDCLGKIGQSCPMCRMPINVNLVKRR